MAREFSLEKRQLHAICKDIERFLAESSATEATKLYQRSGNSCEMTGADREQSMRVVNQINQFRRKYNCENLDKYF